MLGQPNSVRLVSFVGISSLELVTFHSTSGKPHTATREKRFYDRFSEIIYEKKLQFEAGEIDLDTYLKFIKDMSDRDKE